MTATTNPIGATTNPFPKDQPSSNPKNSLTSTTVTGLVPLTRPSESLSITLTPPPLAVVPFYENVSFLVAIITLLGVWISLMAAARRTKQELTASESRMRTELGHAANQASIERDQSREQANLDRKHDATEAHKERITTARRSSYLDAVAELVKTQVFLGGLAKRDLTKLDISSEIGGLLIALAKVGILGEMKTIRQSRTLFGLLNQILFRGLAKVMPLASLSNSASLHDELYASTQLEIQRILAAMTHHNETLKNDHLGFDALQRSFEAQQTAAKHHHAESVRANLALADGQKEYGFELMKEMKVVAIQLDELIYSIRSELDLETDLDELKKLTSIAQAQAEEALKELLVKVDAMRMSADLKNGAGSV